MRGPNWYQESLKNYWICWASKIVRECEGARFKAEAQNANALNRKVIRNI